MADNGGTHLHCPSCGYEEPAVVEWERTYVAVEALLSDKAVAAAITMYWGTAPPHGREGGKRQAMEDAIQAAVDAATGERP